MPSKPTRIALAVAFLTVYLVWGSTYLAIRITLESLPPFLTGATRFVVAGAVMMAWAGLRGAPRPTAAHWRSAFLVGGLLLVGGSGAVMWAETRISSGLAAVLNATVPLWLSVLDRREQTPLAPLLLGLAGILLLVGPGVGTADSLDLVGAAVVLLAALSWATGSLCSRTANLPADPAMATGLQMVGGGALLAAVGFLAGEGWELPHLAPTSRSLLALAYLIVLGSLVGFTAYLWLVRHVPTRYVGTYAYVNPVVAVLLGWALAGERLTPMNLAAIGVVLAALVLLMTGRPGTARVRRPLRWPRRVSGPLGELRARAALGR